LRKTYCGIIPRDHPFGLALKDRVIFKIVANVIMAEVPSMLAGVRLLQHSIRLFRKSGLWMIQGQVSDKISPDNDSA
ncbi:MAG TPA: hypothetical protein PL112_22195, partial [Candidatus Obscuribacter sp.]|nr:hypothetical protein [Candidatus Obscuribacter sp.]